MATSGPNYPGTVASLSNAGTSESSDNWLNPSNVNSDNATESTIVAATYDSPDISELLVCSNFGFALPSAIIDGITVEIDRRSIIASSGKDFRVQLAKGTTFANLVGTNKAVPATIWPSSSTVATYGGVSDLWGTTWTEAEIESSSFAVMISCQANIANADVGIDYVRVTITYHENPDRTATVALTGGGVVSYTYSQTGANPPTVTTTIYLDQDAADATVPTRWASGQGYAKLHDSSVVQIDQRQVKTSTSGATNQTLGATTVTGPTAGVELNPGFSTPILFITPPLNADVAISGTMTVNLYSSELTTSVNAAINLRLCVLRTDGTLTEIHRTVRTTELGTTVALVSFAETVTSFAVSKGERLVLIPFADDGGGNMASGFSASVGMGPANPSNVVITSSPGIAFLSTTPAGTTVYLLNDAASGGIDPGAATEKDAWTTRGSTSVDPGATTITAGPIAGIQYAPGGTAYEWYTRPLAATTLVAPVLVNIRCYDGTGSNTLVARVEIARTDGDGTNASVWASNGAGHADFPYEALTSGDRAVACWVSGPDLAITDGQRLRIRVYFDDVYRVVSGTVRTVASAAATGRISFGGPTTNAAGDSYLTFSQTLTESGGAPERVPYDRRMYQQVIAH